ncbi:hypothetical protein MKW92_039546 [Papaver armeniacum]|nr:hypothetical protein MKW92_039546 [Papaver armeniacum]
MNLNMSMTESTSHLGDLIGSNMVLDGETFDDFEIEDCDNTSRQDNQLVELTVDVGPSEPCIGMEFNSANDGKDYYGAYARRNGFTIRVNRKAKISRFSSKRCLGEDRTILLSKQSRVGCKAILVIAYRREIEKWVVTNFVREHNHDLMGPAEVLVRRSSVKASTEDAKDKRIRELTSELYNERQRFQRRCSAYEERCAAYKVNLGKILKDIELHSEHLSVSVSNILQTIKEVDDEH